jgi:Mg/Co/Ni transporter MgtE
MSRRVLLIAGSLVCLLGAGGVLAWQFWPAPPPTTADQVFTAVMTSDPATMSEKDLERWVETVAATVERLPPHEFEKLVTRALQDDTLRQRFDSLKPETRQKMMSLVSEEQRSRMMAKMGTTMVQYFRAMPPALRRIAFQQMMSRRDAHAGPDGKHPEMTKERIVQHHAATTPAQRAEFVRAMREMRQMMEDAGVGN